MDVHFQKQRYVADNAGNELERIWFHKMKEIFREIDRKAQCIQPAGNIFFLDLGSV